MKLTARKTMVALGTATALTLSGLTAPAMAADAAKPAASTSADKDKTDSSTTKDDTQSKEAKTGDPLYTQKYKTNEANFKRYKALLSKLDEELRAAEANKNITGDSDANAKLTSARRHYDDAQSLVAEYIDGLPSTGSVSSPYYGEIKANETTLSNIKRAIDDARTDLDAAKPVTCDANSVEAVGDDSGSSSSLDFGSLVKSFGSSGQMKVVKDGKQKCVSKVDYYSDKLKSIVSILTVLFTVITTVTKISDTLQKQAMPKR